jgi:hypothetical protein
LVDLRTEVQEEGRGLGRMSIRRVLVVEENERKKNASMMASAGCGRDPDCCVEACKADRAVGGAWFAPRQRKLELAKGREAYAEEEEGISEWTDVERGSCDDEMAEEGTFPEAVMELPERVEGKERDEQRC